MSKTEIPIQAVRDLKGQAPDIKTVVSPQGAYLTLKGPLGGRKLNLCSNNYLGLASDIRLVNAVIKAVKKYGVGPGAVRTLSGTNILHIELEEKLAKFKGAEAAIVLTGGYMANLAAVQTIIGKDDLVISDELNHASIIDAIRLSGVQNKFVYKHNDTEDLEAKLKESRKLFPNHSSLVTLIVTDGVFSMDGDLAPMPEIVRLAKQYSALTMVDDAHGEGVLGDHGRGITNHFGLHGQIDIEVGTLSKAFGVMGGFITGSQERINFYKLKARQFLFSSGLSIADTAALIAAVDILENSDKLVKKLMSNAKYLKDGFTAKGFDCGHSETPITPVMLGDEDLAVNFSKKLFENGVYATPIKYPMVPKGQARIRVMPSAIHTKEDLDLGLRMFEKVGKELGVI